MRLNAGPQTPQHITSLAMDALNLADSVDSALYVSDEMRDRNAPGELGQAAPLAVNDYLRDRVIVAVGAQYLIESEIGRGGMAVVYRAIDVRLNRPVAIKVLPPDSRSTPTSATRFIREAQTAAQLSHPNIVPIYSVDESDGGARVLRHGATSRARASRVRLDARGRLPIDAVATRPARRRRRAGVCARARRRPSRHQAGQHSASTARAGGRW